MKYYRLKEIAKCLEKRREYSKILKNKGADFGHGFIFSAHWSKGQRENIDDLPDLPCAPEFVEKKATKKTTPVRKIESAKRCLQQQSKGSEAKKRRVLSYSSRDEPSNSDILIKEIDDLLEQLRSKTNEVNQLSDLVKTLKIQNETYQSQLQKFPHTTEKTTCSYKCLKKNPKQFFT